MAERVALFAMRMERAMTTPWEATLAMIERCAKHQLPPDCPAEVRYEAEPRRPQECLPVSDRGRDDAHLLDPCWTL